MARKRAAAAPAQPAAQPTTEKPSDDPQALRELAEENVRKAAEALRALKLPNSAEPSTVFRP